MSHFDQILSIDAQSGIVVVQPGARVEQVVKAIAPHGLTLQNYASISEQQLGGFYQVSAHGTGAKIPPVDEQVIAMKLLTPAKGELSLSRESNPELFHMARVAFGSLGIITELTIKCVPRHKLHEKTFVVTKQELKARHQQYLQEFQHVRYMWIPFTNDVIVVGSNHVSGDQVPSVTPVDNDFALLPLRQLVRSLFTESQISEESLKSMNFADLRGRALMVDPLNSEHVKKVNQVEAEFWKRSQGERIDWSENILGFECGDQQWVSEVAFPVPKASPEADIQFVENVLDIIEKKNIAAPSPIEQRWTAASASPMSPAFGNPSEDLFSWVGIIMYLPQEKEQRKAITQKFFEYRDACFSTWQQYKAYEHWAKIEIPIQPEIRAALKSRLSEKYPIEEFKKLKQELDPKGILNNDLTDMILE
jgi:L-galactono-1,4-lactone dehydrogenase